MFKYFEFGMTWEIDVGSVQIIEYTLFQCGLFLDYLTSPYKSAKHLRQMQTPFDYDRGRCIIAEGGNDSRITFTTVQDLAQVVARAIDYEHPWPVVGGISGVEMSLKQMIKLGEKIRGKSLLYSTDRVLSNAQTSRQAIQSWRNTHRWVERRIMEKLMVAKNWSPGYATSEEWWDLEIYGGWDSSRHLGWRLCMLWWVEQIAAGLQVHRGWGVLDQCLGGQTIGRAWSGNFEFVKTRFDSEIYVWYSNRSVFIYFFFFSFFFCFWGQSDHARAKLTIPIVQLTIPKAQLTKMVICLNSSLLLCFLSFRMFRVALIMFV